MDSEDDFAQASHGVLRSQETGWLHTPNLTNLHNVKHILHVDVYITLSQQYLQYCVQSCSNHVTKIKICLAWKGSYQKTIVEVWNMLQASFFLKLNL
jgi:hypothetical protein